MLNFIHNIRILGTTDEAVPGDHHQTQLDTDGTEIDTNDVAIPGPINLDIMKRSTKRRRVKDTILRDTHIEVNLPRLQHPVQVVHQGRV